MKDGAVGVQVEMKPEFFKGLSFDVAVCVSCVCRNKKAGAFFSIVLFSVNGDHAGALCYIVKLVLSELCPVVCPDILFTAGQIICDSHDYVEIGKKRIQIQHIQSSIMLIWYKKRFVSYIYNLF